MKILVINSGSSSLKYQLFDMEKEQVLAKGLCDRIGIQNSFLKYRNNGKEFIKEVELKDHNDAIREVINALTDSEHGVIKSMDEITSVGHRVVHGGEKFYKSAIIDDEVLSTIEECIELAPLHNGPNMIGIKACKNLCRMCQWLLYLIRHSTRPCPKRRSYTHCHIPCMRSRVCAVTVSTVHPTSMLPKGLP